MNYLYLFYQSNLLEMPAYYLFLNKARPQWSFLEKFVFITGMNSVTHPIVFFFVMNLSLTYLQNILIAECFAIGMEAMILSLVLKERFTFCLLISLFANFLSWQLAPMVTFSLF
ncbi:MAG: hypothetical protein ACXVLQ_12530 [Bacteriovorax sp.]